MSKTAHYIMKDVYLGAGKHRLDGWIHVDKHPYEGIDVVCDVTKGLPFEDSTVDRIYTQDFMEHLPPESKVPVINEMWRVLKNGGTMEHYIPNAGSRNDFGSPTHLSHWNLQQFEHFDIDSYRYEIDHEYEGTVAKFRKVFAELVNFNKEDNMYQSIHVRYTAIK